MSQRPDRIGPRPPERPTRATLDGLIERLLDCTSISDPAVRSQVLERLPRPLQGQCGRQPTLKAEVHQLVSVCADHPDGLAELRAAVRFFESTSRAMADLDRFMVAHGLTRPVDDLSVSPPERAARNHLHTQLQRELHRKHNLERAGANTAQVIEEIKRLKRAMRTGGRLSGGDLLGSRYLLLERLGSGGFATVWLARDQETETPVAVKVLHSEHSGHPVKRDRFFRGARIMAELRHEAVVRVIEKRGQDDGFHYFVMEYVDGGNLRQAVCDGRVTGAQALSIVQRISRGLALAHRRGYVHRDVKPSNILLTRSGEVKLSDFDLVADPDTTGGTRTGAMGTVLYAAPEMWERPQEADLRADVYSLAVTCAFIVHGGKLPQRQMLRDAPGFVDTLTAFEPAMRAAIKRALSWEPDNRFADAEAFCAALSGPAPDPAELGDFRWPEQTGFEALHINVQGLFDTLPGPDGDLEPSLSSDRDTDTWSGAIPTLPASAPIPPLRQEARPVDALTPVPGDPRLKPGMVLDDRYLLVQQRGARRGATVWQAEDLQHPAPTDRGTVIAVKVLRTVSDQRLTADRLMAATAAGREIEHPAIARIFDVRAEPDGLCYYTTELLDGDSLRLAVLAGQLRPAEAIPITLRLGSGLALAHTLGHVHGHVNPNDILLIGGQLMIIGNSLLRSDRQIKLIDFGMSSHLDGRRGRTLYNAPEQWEQDYRPDPRADVFGLAMTCAFVLHGARLPLESVLRSLPGFINSLRNASRTVRVVLKDALRLDVRSRTPNMELFCAELQRATTRG